MDDLLDSAGAALTRGLLHERYGAWFRRRIYAWSYNRHLPPGLARLLIGICDGVIAPLRPGQALVRLRHFAHHADEDVAGEARATLARLAEDGLFARRMLARVHADLVGGRPRAIDFDLFTDVADPSRLTAPGAGAHPRGTERHVHQLLADCWASWLENQPYERFATAASPRGAPLLDVLAAATNGRPRSHAVLYAAARDWVAQASTPPERRVRQRTAAVLQRTCQTHPTERHTEDGVTDPC